MIETKEYKDVEGRSAKARYKTVDNCPLCHEGIEPIIYGGSIDVINKKLYLSLHCGCRKCKNSFLARYKPISLVNEQPTFEFEAILDFCEPFTVEQKKFTENIRKLSPTFVKIYSQAARAEEINLNEIAGMGYRKSIEYLIKDYAIHYHQDDSVKISRMNLLQCINKYIEDEKLKQLAIASTWLGNDETHYVRIHEDYDINDLKSFLNSTISLIECHLNADLALELISKKPK